MKKILIFGLPGSGKSTLANKLSKKLDCLHLNADEVREKFKDWDFSDDGRLRQAYRMKQLAEENKNQYVILDFVCPKKQYRNIISPDISIFMDTIIEGRFKDTNSIFEKPTREEKVNYIFKTFDSDKHVQNILKKLITFNWRNPTVQMLGRWQPFHDGHVALFKRAFKKTKQVVIQVRDCQDWNNTNPFNYYDIKNGIIKKLSQENFVLNKDYVIMLVPNIINITYGRDVGYKIEEEVFDEKITNISATKIRKKMGYKK